ncbi:MAG: FecR family protein [Steroidobacteraceae bacterium]|jgi:hypothetical protein|nr:FecR family protein [Steroidobacteraceae bacterium]
MKRDNDHLEEEAEVAAVVRRALPREPDPAARDRARAAVAAEWRAALAVRRGVSTQAVASQGRSWTGRAPRLALAAGLLLTGVAAVFTWRASQEEPAAGPMVAQVERGEVSAEGAPIAMGADVAAGRAITAAGGGALLRLGPSLTLRLSAGTEATFASATRVELEQGRLFVDAAPGAGAALEIATSHGEVRHLGTQYEVVDRDGVVEVAVREGRVQLLPTEGTPVEAGAGELLRARGGAAPELQALADPEARFAWLAALPSAITIDGRSLAEFLAWYARETGRSVSFADPALERTATAAVLSGSVDGLAPEAALDVVMASTDLSAARRPGVLLIGSHEAR